MISLKGTLNVRTRSRLFSFSGCSRICPQIIDNTGALLAECVNVLKHKTNHGFASVGDEIVVVIQRARALSTAASSSSAPSAGGAVKVRRGDVRRAVVVRTRKPVIRPDGRVVRFDDNAAVLLNAKREMLGTRIGGVVSADLRYKGWGKIVSLAPKVSRCQREAHSCALMITPGHIVRDV